ncbi:lactoylglutathione lyase [Chishuiella changwenlii]|uniref:Lactoylglutathione lyase n=1 Tax=Chishuiella changwenlii TaxID=1434701 RepID=A0A1M6Y0D3_9FLAO|nr:VOC family protein [Chishuiella changwenlii]GGE93925.1 hypothetical protein GCM10010984_09460 [Chishuiella changwenlii]SHL11657.1 lactoylglutathione lyase [Chishuiella changwenlii]
MRIEHIAIWVSDLELMKNFYETYFEMSSGKKYMNIAKHFQSYFLSFNGLNKTRIELMHKPDLFLNEFKRDMLQGFAHIAISVGSKEKVDDLTNKLRNDGYTVIGEPRTTGDGYYESIVEDPERNWIEITE